MQASTPPFSWRPWHLLALAGFLLLLALVGWQHLQSPLGQAPQLDGKENLALARQIADGQLPAEPFYRAPGYPALLAGGLKLGLPGPALPAAATLLGLLAHAGSTLLVFLLARRFWRDANAGWAAAALFGLYPVAWFFAVDVLDLTPALTAALAGLYLLTHPKVGTRDLLLGGLCLGIAALLRPHFLTLVAVAPLLAWPLRQTWRWHNLLAWSGGAACLLLFGVLNLAHSGSFQMLPLQGGYNLYLANHAEANGRYLQQRVVVEDRPDHRNPMQLEAAALYTEATGAEQADPVTVAAYWRGQALRQLWENPVESATLLLKKVYFLLSDFEGYNNKSYGFHAGLNPLLGWNPLGWGLLLALCSAAMVLAVHRREAWLRPWAIAFGAYAAGALLFFICARFRLPLVPLLALPAGGLLAMLPRLIREREATAWPSLGAAAAIALLVAFSGGLGVVDRTTYLQDQLLLASAAAEAGDDAQAYQWAARVLARDDDRAEALHLAVLSYFNLRMTGHHEAQRWSDWEQQSAYVRKLKPGFSAAQDLVAGVVVWNLGKHEAAARIWRSAAAAHGADSGELLGALVWTGHAGRDEHVAALALAEALQGATGPFLHCATAQALALPARPEVIEAVTRVLPRPVESEALARR